MLEGKKPLAMFYAEISELPHEELVPESKFKPYLDGGRFVRGETTLELAYHPKLNRNVRVKYVFFALRTEEWRIPAIALVLQTGLKSPTKRTNDWLAHCSDTRRQKLMRSAPSSSGQMQPNSALLSDAFRSLRCACGAAKRER